MNTERFTEREQFILRVTLFLAMVFTLVFPLIPARQPVQQEPEIGMGGGLLPEQIELASEMEDENLEILGIPEPLEFSRPVLLVYDSYKVEKGDTISEIARKLGLYEDTLLSVNEIKNSRLLQIGQILKIPNQDGIYYTVNKGDTLLSVAEKYTADPEAVKTVNELFSDSLDEKTRIFIPGARMDWVNRQEINGDLFLWPVRGPITSNYGYRSDPFGSGSRQFHYGMDIGVPSGTTVKAAMAGRVTTTGFNEVYGNHVVISHHSGYRTLYAHLSVISTKSGAYVSAGEKIGLVGSTGRSTAAHLHFTVYKNGVTVNPRNLIN